MKKRNKIQIVFLLFLASLLHFSAIQAGEYITVRIKSNSYEIRDFRDENILFTNRNYIVENIPEDFYDYCYVAKNAGKSLQYSDIEVLAEPDKNGFIYLIAAHDSWFKGWRQVKNGEFHYTDHRNSKLALFRKKVKRGETVSLPDDESFAGTILLAKSIKYLKKEAVEIEGDLLDIRRVFEGETVFPQNNTFKFRDDLPTEIHGLQYGVSFIERKGVERIKVGPDVGNVYLAVSSENLDSNDWNYLGKSFMISSKRTYFLYKLKNISKKEWIKIPYISNSSQQLVSPTLIFSEELTWSNPQQVPGVIITKSEELKLVNIANPSLVVLPDGNYLAACTGALRKSSERGGVSFFVSEDKGKTWKTRSANSVSMTFYTVFIHKNELYIIGTNRSYGNVVIAKSNDWGVTWSDPVPGSGLIRDDGFYHSAPVPVVFHEGRIWRSMEKADNRQGQNKQALVISASLDANLLKSESWTFSNALASNSEWISEDGKVFKQWIEGNIVIDKNGTPVNILRVDEEKMGGVAAIVRVISSNKITFDPQNDLIDFPGGGKKFTIRYDSITDKYWTITNAEFNEDRYKTQEGIYRNGIHCGLLRNRVVLMCSDDLRKWEVRDTLLSSDNPFVHGFQYVDWQFEGNDIIAISRTAYEEERGLPTRQHDANFLLFHRFKHFRGEGFSSNPTILNKNQTLYFDSNTRKAILNNEDYIDFSIFSLSGQTITQEKGFFGKHICFNSLPKGVYFLLVKSKEKKYINKILLN